MSDDAQGIRSQSQGAGSVDNAIWDERVADNGPVSRKRVTNLHYHTE